MAREKVLDQVVAVPGSGVVHADMRHSLQWQRGRVNPKTLHIRVFKMWAVEIGDPCIRGQHGSEMLESERLSGSAWADNCNQARMAPVDVPLNLVFQRQFFQVREDDSRFDGRALR